MRCMAACCSDERQPGRQGYTSRLSLVVGWSWLDGSWRSRSSASCPRGRRSVTSGLRPSAGPGATKTAAGRSGPTGRRSRRGTSWPRRARASCTRAGACASLAACTCNPGKTVRQAAPLQDCCARRGSLVPGHARSRRDAEDAMIIVPLHGSCTGIGNEAVEMPAEEAWYLAFGGSNPNTGPTIDSMTTLRQYSTVWPDSAPECSAG